MAKIYLQVMPAAMHEYGEDGSITGLCHRGNKRQLHERERKWFLKTVSVGRAMSGYILCMVAQARGPQTLSWDLIGFLNGQLVSQRS